MSTGDESKRGSVAGGDGGGRGRGEGGGGVAGSLTKWIQALFEEDERKQNIHTVARLSEEEEHTSTFLKAHCCWCSPLRSAGDASRARPPPKTDGRTDGYNLRRHAVFTPFDIYLNMARPKVSAVRVSYSSSTAVFWDEQWQSSPPSPTGIKLLSADFLAFKNF